MYIKNKDLKRELREKGRQYVLMLYINRFIHMTEKQLDYVLSYGGRNGKKTHKPIQQDKMRSMRLSK